MSRSKILISLTVLLLASLACSFVAPTETTAPSGTILQSEDEVPRIPLDQALAAMQSGAAISVDVRSTEAYEASHVPGAISIPLLDIESDPNGLPLEKDQWIITYCT